MNLSGNDKNKITGKKYQPVMSITGLNDQGLRCLKVVLSCELRKCIYFLRKSNLFASSFFMH